MDDGSMDTLWQRMFRNFRVVRRCEVTYSNTRSTDTTKMTTLDEGFEISGDERLRGKAFREYARQRMSAVRFLKPGVPYLTFKHANLQAKRSMCLDRFKLSDASSYFFRLLVRRFGRQKLVGRKQHFGSNFDDLHIPRHGVRYLGSPGRQGVAILITDEITGLDYVIKLAHSVGDGGTGEGFLTRSQMRKKRETRFTDDGGALGFIAQARFQMISAMHNCSVPVYACGVANDPNVPKKKRIPLSFMVMPPLKMLAHEFYQEKWRHHSWDLVERHMTAKYYNLSLRMDTHVGIIHNDINVLNIMVDEEDDMLYIDFDRATFIRHLDLLKYGLYVNGELMFMEPFGNFRLLVSGVANGSRRHNKELSAQLFHKDEAVEADEIARLNTRKTPAEVPPLESGTPASDLAFGPAQVTKTGNIVVRSQIFGVQDSLYAGLRF